MLVIVNQIIKPVKLVLSEVAHLLEPIPQPKLKSMTNQAKR
tara:strand:- start:642 stop:764 length:123 start_codon:yes stop_codon:yes gene_type:complete